MTQLHLTVHNADYQYSVDAHLSGVTVLFGPSGVGKTTLLRTIAGFSPDMTGTLTYGGETLQNSADRVFVPAHKRGIATVFQDSRLFTHLSVKRNLAYAQKRAQKPEGPQLATVIEALDLEPLLGQMPETLSGGEKQRVAIGRALVSRPNLILMDEPLASLDTDRKGDILPYVAALPSTFDLPVIYVTHAVAEVAQIATQVLHMTSGDVPAAVPTADFLGARMPRVASIIATVERVENGQTRVRIQDQTIVIDGILGAAGDIIHLRAGDEPH